VSDLHETEDGRKDTGESDRGRVDPDVTSLALLGAGSAAASRCRADATWCALETGALVFALDDVVGALLTGEDGAGAGNVGEGLDVEGTTVVLESWERDAMQC